MSARPIILAEDNDNLRRLYSDTLESAGFSVMRASDGEKPISLLHKIANPQPIILDVMMPRLDGVETCIRMRKVQGLAGRRVSTTTGRLARLKRNRSCRWETEPSARPQRSGSRRRC